MIDSKSSQIGLSLAKSALHPGESKMTSAEYRKARAKVEM